VKRADAFLLGVVTGAATAVIAYAAVRGVERVLFLEPNPAALIWSDRSPFLWRAVIALYVGGAASFGGFAAARRSSVRTARGLFALVVLAVAAVIAQGALLP
jgi:hypothetical protein